MKTRKQAQLSSEWVEISAQEFLGLSDSEAAFIEVRVRLAIALRTHRASLGFTQAEVAKRLKSSQSRVAKMEAADSSVTVDLILQALFRLGATAEDIATAIAPTPNPSQTVEAIEPPLSLIARATTNGFKPMPYRANTKITTPNFKGLLRNSGSLTGMPV